MVIQNFFKKLGFYLLILLVLIFTLFPFVQMLSTSLKHQFDWGNPSLIPVKVNLNAGDMLVYKGMLLEHWRETFIGNNCAQVFLHYNDVKSEGAEKNMFDGRPHLGLPAWFKDKKIYS